MSQSMSEISVADMPDIDDILRCRGNTKVPPFQCGKPAEMIGYWFHNCPAHTTMGEKSQKCRSCYSRYWLALNVDIQFFGEIGCGFCKQMFTRAEDFVRYRQL
jgi:hypothetical protein